MSGTLKEIYIIGAGGFGREVAWLIERINALSPTWHIAGFLDDNEQVHGNDNNGYKVLGGLEQIDHIRSPLYIVIAIGNPNARQQVLSQLEENSRSADTHIQFPVLIDPSVILSDRVSIGEGSLLCAGLIGTVGITIGKHVHINLDCTLGHEASIEDFSTLYPSVNVSGAVQIKQGCEIGTGTQILQGIIVGKNARIGAGAVVTRDIPPNCTAVGIPAKPVRL
jgi:sugar O-acyltransferase (sialic acid O-acetyltransferase NeuD family)